MSVLPVKQVGGGVVIDTTAITTTATSTANTASTASADNSVDRNWASNVATSENQDIIKRLESLSPIYASYLRQLQTPTKWPLESTILDY